MQEPTPAEAQNPTLSTQSSAGALGGGIGEADTVEQLDEISSALSGDVTAIPLDVAATMVARWQETLTATGDPELRPVTVTLSELQAQLSGGLNPDDSEAGPGAIGLLMGQLSAQVAGIAAGQSGPVADALQRLSEALAGAGGAPVNSRDF